MHPLILELQTRGLVADCTDLAGLDARLHRGPTKVYVGFDPTAASLHVGSLMPLFVASLVLRHGHVPVLLVGGATGMIGDPSGRSDERNMLSDAELDANRAALREQMTRLVGAGTDGPVEVVDNRDWLGQMGVLEFLRDVGRHFRIGDMLARESVRSRLDSESGLSFTELSYQLLQAFDFWWLQANCGVEVQVGGSDQWGNITAGIDFMRRRSGDRGFGLVWPLLTKADGSKFGKSLGGNVWLDADLTRPFTFWQFWFNTDDADLERMLLRFSDRPVTDLVDLVRQHGTDPARRMGQRILANDVTAWVHGPDAARRAELAADVLFSDHPMSTSEAQLVADEAGSLDLTRTDLVQTPVASLAVSAGLCTSLSEARRLGNSRGLRIESTPKQPDAFVTEDEVLPSGCFRLRKGRRHVVLVRVLESVA